MTNNKYLINAQTFEDLKEEHKMILAIKGAIEEIKKNPKLENVYGAFIYATINKLKEEYNISKDEIFKYRFNFINCFYN